MMRCGGGSGTFYSIDRIAVVSKFQFSSAICILNLLSLVMLLDILPHLAIYLSNGSYPSTLSLGLVLSCLAVRFY